MTNPISTETIQSLLIEIRGEKVLLDSEVAKIYGVQTRDINKAVQNNPDKFPSDYLVTLTVEEKRKLVENFHRFQKIKHSSVTPKAFSEKGLYMLATILKSPAATKATFAIIETFAKLRELSSTIRTLSTIKDDTAQKTLMNRGGDLVSELFDESLQTSDTETSIELNFAVLKFRHSVKRKK